MANSGTPTVGSTGLIVANNIINSKQRGMYVSFVNDGDIYGNTFSINSTASQASSGIMFISNIATQDTFNLYNNVFTALTTMNNTAGNGNGIVGFDIQTLTPKVFNIYNNMISGFGTFAATTNAKLYGIRVVSTATCNIFNNTIYIPEMTNMTAFGTSYIAGIGYCSLTEAAPKAGGSISIKSNIIVSDETSMKVYAVRRPGADGTFISANNNLFINAANTSGFIGYYNTADQQTLANWTAASSQDSASSSVAVSFVSATDLHLSGSSIGDKRLGGVPVSFITKDIDGENRDANIPYMGADENIAFPLPVELTSFTAIKAGKSVELRWTTATELNNNYFDIERKSTGKSWEKIASVKGNGTTSQGAQYRYVDNSVSGSASYRLKQVDFDGSYSYSQIIETNGSLPEEYSLSQNYPNPFNPSTVIRYALPQDSKVKLQVYSITGQLVAELVNGQENAGEHSIRFNASGLASGTYIYRLQAGSFIQTKKLTLIK